MKLLFSGAGLTAPTFDTLKEYSEIRFKNLEKLLTRMASTHIKISVHKEKYNFVVTVELLGGHPMVVKTTSEDLRAAIDISVGKLRRMVTKNK